MLKTYNVKAIKSQDFSLTEKNDKLWDEANVLADFCSPWDNTPIHKIEFRALYNTQFLYFNFKVYDTNIYISNNAIEYDGINNSDRVELFFRSNNQLNPYYCLEIDPTPRLMDFKARHYRDFDFSWNWPLQDIEIQSAVNKTYFTVTGKISLKSLRALNLLHNNKIEVGVFRAKYNKQPDNSYAATWISWVNPKTEEPDFHTPSAFGLFCLEP